MDVGAGKIQGGPVLNGPVSLGYLCLFEGMVNLLMRNEATPTHSMRALPRESLPAAEETPQVPVLDEGVAGKFL